MSDKRVGWPLPDGSMWVSPEGAMPIGKNSDGIMMYATEDEIGQMEYQPAQEEK